MSVNNSSKFIHQNRGGYSTKTIQGKQKMKRETSKHGLKERSNNQQNMPQSNMIKNNIPKQSIPLQQRTSIPPKSRPVSQVMKKLDNDFVQLLSQVQEYYTKLTKHQQIRVQKWIVKIIQKDETLRWKQNRNNYIKLLYHIVRHNQCLLQPFDKIPDPDRDLPYLSEYEYSVRTKSRNDSKLSIFQSLKPQIVKINQPKGDSCSVLMSLVNTARTVKDKENAMSLEQGQGKFDKEIINTKILDGGIKESQLIEYSRQYSRINSKVTNDTVLSLEGKNDSANDQVKFSSSAIPSNLPSCNPSQVKQSITPFSHSFLLSKSELASQKSRQGKQIQVTKFSKQRVQNSGNHSKSPISNDNIQHNNPLNNKKKKGITSSSIQHLPSVNQVSQSLCSQLSMYNELVLTMGKLLLKNQPIIQAQSEYWNLLRIIYSYHLSSKNNSRTNNHNIIRSSTQYYQNSQQSLNSFGTDESFQQFISRLEQQVNLNIKQQPRTQSENNTSLNKISSNLDPSPLIFSLKNQQLASTNKRLSHVQQYPPQQQMNKNLMGTNNQTEILNHITEQSLDFKVEEGLESEDMLYYELGNRRRQSEAKEEVEGRGLQNVVGGQRLSVECQSGVVNNEQRLQSSQHMSNSLMQISDSYRQIRRHNNPTQKHLPPKTYFIANNPNSQDYHNVYDDPSDQEDEISFTDKQLIDEEEEDCDSDGIEVECENGEDGERRQQEDNPVFTEDDEDSQDYEEDDYELDQEQQFYDEDDEGFYHAQPGLSKQPPNNLSY